MPEKARKASATKRLGRLLKDAVDAGTPVSVIARRADVDASLIYRFLRGEAPGCTLDTAERLMEAVGSDRSELFGKRESAPGWVVAALAKLHSWAKGE